MRKPPVLTVDDLVVEHRDRTGAVAVYDFRALPVEDALRRSLAHLFAARCVPSRWTSHQSSRYFWLPLQVFTAYLATLDSPVSDLDQLTAGVWQQWRLSRPNTPFGYRQITTVRGLLLDDPRLSAAAREALARRVLKPTAKEVSFQAAEFDAIVTTARRMFRAAHLRISDNARHLAEWRSGTFPRGSEAWLLGEALDCLARTGEAPHDTRVRRQRGRALARYARVLGGERPEHTWQRLFLTRMETVALGVLLLAEHGWNLSVINRLKVPQAAPDVGSDGPRIYRVELEKHKRGAGRYFETRNLTDDGAASPGRLITQALEATVFARAAVHTLSPGTDRLLIWRSAKAPLELPQDETGKRSGVGVFGFGISGRTAKGWATQQGFASSPFRRGRRTVNSLHRRAPGQNSQATHDRVYTLTDLQVRQRAIPVIAEAAEAVVTRAHATVLAAELREGADPADQPTVTADCHDYDNSPYPGPGGGCGASFLMCLACPNARIHPAHHSRLAHLHHALDNLRTVLDSGQWQSQWQKGHARLEHLKSQLGTAVWTRALADVTDTDRELIALLLNGDLDP
ncbi:hypothetical protein EF914_04445 [Streptomyces sp. WAC05458]|uniref:hypothetical protein n=1 Tax=Streptomyces sp. WAC05458 TaxID=2487412 RepID=UPI000F9A57AD|nr:hypothetical protein [Streptomyces sp. WAC05458]RSS26089.1 hypothetical protein EF914_04445 [Streptomyces sp. WAC05458]